ncbi:hypothetical protein LZ575_16825 [Antarcticibacterium sp. 1MA-6-2]|uniref:cellulase N-terminal Ig-like domain-containing protein n=1 Tax=Antarcticibacterium sp. 1MA-6-2 TaxID=2908210 RepID=UPI001F427D79|nr:cellulase N-terminal Ig-like domain-containing protein [Antarcticibacterium sp. 1MA-6-2]UJH90465.1 hypothetical protein LZ575_16825 [Antarcticibacterium sp. 1MA-6-2]
MRFVNRIIFIIITSFYCFTSLAQTAEDNSGSEKIRLNQIGFYPEGPKTAVILGAENLNFEILKADSKEEVFSGTLSKEMEWPHSKEMVRQADFSSFTKPGDYVLHISGIGNSFTFEIREDVHLEPAKASLKAFYFQRASTNLTEEYAGKWAREVGHPDTAVKVHNSAATEKDLLALKSRERKDGTMREIIINIL